MKFTKKKIITPENQPEWVYTQVAEGTEQPFPPFQILVSKLGVKLEGKTTTLTDMRDLQDFAQVVSEAWVDHDKLLKAATGAIQVTTEMPK